MEYCPIQSISQTLDTSFDIDSNNAINNYVGSASTGQTKFYNDINTLYDKNKFNYANTKSQLQWNMYYYKMYQAENNVLYFIMKVCVIIIILTLIKKQFPFFDDNAYSIIIVIISVVTMIRVMYSVWNLIYKDNMNYDENDYLYSNKHMVDTNGVAPTIVPMQPTKSQSEQSEPDICN